MSNRKRRLRNIKQAVMVVLIVAAVVVGYVAYSAWSESRRLLRADFLLPSGIHSDVFKLELAVSDAERHQGLMYRRQESIPERGGMLFVFPREEKRTFWMKNTLASLDMLFLDKDLRVVGILKNVPPLTEDRRSVDAPSMYVVELKGGTSEHEHLVEGAKLSPSRPLPVAVE